MPRGIPSESLAASLGNGEILHLIDICPPATGTMELCLDNVAGTVNWGLAVYDYDDGAVQANVEREGQGVVLSFRVRVGVGNVCR